ncbi:AfsR/SARP family transcriptional regulator [Actinoallomurus soli]|uniref:AfsR/SARP family transcriptional regulator n=1 Tax=Actinoallomurus soli TaxID=2952535 RepID=UPI003873AF5F|nr:AfsR/SARP family transcriptional regulator [Actinoallomurus soli]
MRYEILGPLRIVSGGREFELRSHKMQVLLATLLVRYDQVVPADRLLGELWGQDPPRRADASLYVYISQLRKFISSVERAESKILTKSPGYMLSIGAAELDFERFYDLLSKGRELYADGHPQEAAAVLSEAIELHRGPVLGGLPCGPTVTNFATLVEELRLECLEILIEANLALGRHREMIGLLYSLTAEHPLREVFYELLMTALHRCGRSADALRTYHHARTLIVEELGVDPGRPLRELHQTILTDDAKERAGGRRSSVALPGLGRRGDL